MTKTSLIRSIEQNRAAFAYNKVEEVVEVLSTKEQKEYKAYAKKIPVYIKTNGLGATLAFIYSKSSGNKAYQLLYKQIGEWLRKEETLIHDTENLAKEIVCLNSLNYKKATIEVLSLFKWLRRFAEGSIKGEESDEG